MERQKAEQVLRQVEELRGGRGISILTLSEPISSAGGPDTNNLRTSDVSNSSTDTPTPASLEADLAHYKELFAKLRFSYVEQVTKEKFIRAIVGEPPLIVSTQENLVLEKQNLAAKAQLKSLKLQVADMVAELETKGRELSQRYERVQLETRQLRDLPDTIARLEKHIAELKATQEQEEDDPLLNLPLARTLQLAEEKKAENDDLGRQLEQLQSSLSRKRKERDRLQAGLRTLEAKRQNSGEAAREARRRKEAALGGVQDDLEERGRWLRASESLLAQILEGHG